jgi:hypothetical protein
MDAARLRKASCRMARVVVPAHPLAVYEHNLQRVDHLKYTVTTASDNKNIFSSLS